MSNFLEMRFEAGKLDPQTRELLDTVNASGEPDFSKIDPFELREMGNQRLLNLKRSTGDPVHRIINLSIPGTVGEIHIRIYTPDGKGCFPVLFYIHGGGWLLGNFETHDNVCRALCKRADYIVVAIDYRLSPEHKFPAGFEDVCMAIEWIYENIENYNGNKNFIAVAGDSAGGNFTAALTIKLRNEGKSYIKYQMLLYPSVNMSELATDSFRQFKTGYMLTLDKTKYYLENYLNDEKDSFSIYASPILCEDLKGLPPAHIVTAEYDVLRDEAEEYAEKLRIAGNEVTCTRYNGMIHAFLNMDRVIDKIDIIYDELAEKLKKAVTA